jgi:hypothetical protein
MHGEDFDLGIGAFVQLKDWVKACNRLTRVTALGGRETDLTVLDELGGTLRFAKSMCGSTSGYR